jgi:fucose 4-O-acetylase-like acetyltransferase
MTSTNTHNRIEYIDWAKALGMLTIIWGHIKLTGWSNDFVYAFHIPFFFFLSGIVFSKDRYVDFKHFFMRKVKTLLYPYLIFSVATWAFWALYSYFTHASVKSYWMPLLQTFVAQGSGGFLEHNVPLWFVTCLFCVEMLYWMISRLKDGTNLVVSLLCALVGYLLVYHCKFWDFRLLPWSFESALMAMPFFALGNLLVKRISHENIIKAVRSHKWICIGGMLIGFALTAFIGHRNGVVSMGHSRLGNNPLVFYVTAFVGIVSMLVLCILVSGLFAQENRLSLGVKWFGKNSFNAMAIHNPLRAFIMVIVARFFHTTDVVISKTTSLSLLSFVVTLIVTCIGMWMIEYGNKHFRKSSVSK